MTDNISAPNDRIQSVCQFWLSICTVGQKMMPCDLSSMYIVSTCITGFRPVAQSGNNSSRAHTNKNIQVPITNNVVNKGFPAFGITQNGVHVSTLKNYNLPEFILEMIAQECNSNLLEKGRLDDRLQSMNEQALKMLYRIFVDCEEDEEGNFAHYRFFAHISSAFHKCEILVNESIPGESGNHKFPVAVKNRGMYVAVAYNKSVGNSVSKREITRFYNMVDNVKKGEHGTLLSEAIYGSSVGIKNDAIEELQRLSQSRPNDEENRIDFRVANFENKIYTTTKC